MVAAGPWRLLLAVDPAGATGLGVLWLIVAVAAVVALLWWRRGATYDFRVKVRGREVSVDGKRIPANLRGELHDFFLNDFPPKQRLTVYGRRRRNRTYELRFSGPVTAGEKQQVRNFLSARV